MILPLASGGVELLHLFVHQLASRFFFHKLADHPLLVTMLQERISYLLFLLVSTGEVSKNRHGVF